jgi:hypothetical protein
MVAIDIDDFVQLCIGFFVTPIILISITRRALAYKRQTGTIGFLRKLIIVTFMAELLRDLINFGIMMNLIPSAWMVPGSQVGLGINTVATGLTVTIGLTFTFYLLSWERAYYAPEYIFAAMVAYLFISSGHSEEYPYFVYIGGALALVLFIKATIHIKDNNAMGLAMYFLIGFANMITTILFDPATASMLGIIIITGRYAFGLVYAFGLFRPFKEIPASPEKLTITVEVH